ncbi:MAG: hypothetical protein ACXWHB_14665 [Usitatibacter sp.]
MLKKLRRSSQVTLVLVGVASLTACGRAEDQRRDVYKSREDCLADWGNKPEDCKPATEPRHASSGFWYGPMYHIPYGYSGGSAWTQGARSGSHAIGSSAAGSSHGGSSVSRGGFGSSAHSSSGG